jgi:autotransporter-associated beta strand protein
MKRHIRNSIPAIMIVSLTTGLASGGGLLVDFSPTSAWVQSDAAGFVFANGAASPQTTPYTPGSQGYGQIYGESSVSAQLQTFKSTDGTLNPSTIRMISRGSVTGNLINDYATCEPGTSIPNVGLQLNITGLESGTYDFTSLHGDTDNQSGVVDVQYSLDGGTTWINSPYDNTPYLGVRTLGNALRIALTGLQVDAAHGLSIRYLAGGGLFGTAGATTNGSNLNRLFPLNSFTVSGVSTLVDAYWKGGFPDPVTSSSGVWAATDGNALSNWATDTAGANTPLVPGSATTVRFSATGALDQGDMVLGAPMAVAGIVVNDDQDCLLNADGNTLLLGAGGITLGANAALSIAPPLVLAASQTWTNPGDSVLTVSGAVSGGGSLTKEGAGTLTLTGATAYSGTTLVKEGTMSQAANTTGLVTIEQGAIYRITGGGGQSGTFAGAGTLVLTGPANTKGNAVDARQMTPGATVAVGINGDWINSDSGSQWGANLHDLRSGRQLRHRQQCIGPIRRHDRERQHLHPLGIGWQQHAALRRQRRLYLHRQRGPHALCRRDGPGA